MMAYEVYDDTNFALLVDVAKILVIGEMVICQLAHGDHQVESSRIKVTMFQTFKLYFFKISLCDF